MTEADDTFAVSFERDRLLRALEKLKLAASHLERDDAPIQERLKRALVEMFAVGPADLPYDLREQLAPVRDAMLAGSLEMTTMKAAAIGQAILRLRFKSITLIVILPTTGLLLDRSLISTRRKVLPY